MLYDLYYYRSLPYNIGIGIDIDRDERSKEWRCSVVCRPGALAGNRLVSN